MCKGSAVGKQRAADAVKLLSRNTEIKNSLLQLGLRAASALA